VPVSSGAGLHLVGKAGAASDQTKDDTMGRTRKFDFIISIHSKGDGDAWLVEDRKHPAGSDGHRTSRLSLDLGCDDISGLSPRQLAWRLAHALTDAMEQSDEYGFFSS